MLANRSKVPPDPTSLTNLSIKQGDINKIIASSAESTPRKGVVSHQDSVSKKGMLSDFFAKSDAKLDSFKQPRQPNYSVYTKKPVNAVISTRSHLSTRCLTKRKVQKQPPIVTVASEEGNDLP